MWCLRLEDEAQAGKGQDVVLFLGSRWQKARVCVCVGGGVRLGKEKRGGGHTDRRCWALLLIWAGEEAVAGHSPGLCALLDPPSHSAQIPTGSVYESAPVSRAGPVQPREEN